MFTFQITPFTKTNSKRGKNFASIDFFLFIFFQVRRMHFNRKKSSQNVDMLLSRLIYIRIARSRPRRRRRRYI